jgi:hypothetical protein
MHIAYDTTVGDIQFVVTIKELSTADKIELLIGTVNTEPQINGTPLQLSKKTTIRDFLKRYTSWIIDTLSNVNAHIAAGMAFRTVPEDKLPEACEACAYWGNPEDTEEVRVCRFWDMPERPCVTGRHEHCSKGYVPNEPDDIRVWDVAVPNIYDASKPPEVPDDDRHLYLKSYLDSLHKKDSPTKAVGDAFTTIWDAFKPVLRDVDKFTKK